MSTQETFEGWAILELMGHRRLAGCLTEAVIGGATFLRLDVPGKDPGDDLVATQFYSPSAVYCITPTTEEICRGLTAARDFQAPVQRWELPAEVEDPVEPDTFVFCPECGSSPKHWGCDPGIGVCGRPEKQSL